MDKNMLGPAIKDTDLKETIRNVLEAHGRDSPAAMADGFRFLAGNLFFGHRWEFDGKRETILVSKDAAAGLSERLVPHVEHGGDPRAARKAYLEEELSRRLPVTWERLQRLREMAAKSLDMQTYEMDDFLAAFMDKELHLMANAELEPFFLKMCGETTVKACTAFACLAGWAKDTYGDAAYTISLVPSSRATTMVTGAYSFDEILRFFYLFYGAENIGAEQMFAKACADPAYSATWLIICLHLICSLRDTDLDRLPFPVPEDPAEVIESIRQGTLPEEAARKAITGLMADLGYLELLPNKIGKAGEPSIFLYIPPEQEAFLGKLFLLNAAHVSLHGDKDRPFQKAARDYWKIREVMGEALAEPFRERNACPTAFSRSFMQGLAIKARELGDGTTLAAVMLGYCVASRARSHKGGYGSFATSTAAYLRDNGLSFMSSDYVVQELTERGVLSNVISMFLELISDGAYNGLTFTQQTPLIKCLGITPMQAENMSEAFLEIREKAASLLGGALSRRPGTERDLFLQDLMHKLAIGVAPGKGDGALCLAAALGDPCAIPAAANCLACPYRIDTRATILRAAGEYRRLHKLSREAVSKADKMRYGLIQKQYLVPTLANALGKVEDHFGEEAAAFLNGILSGALQDLCPEGLGQAGTVPGPSSEAGTPSH